MVTRLRKHRWMRGHVSEGHGRIGRRRKHPAGHGLAGGQHHMRILFDKFHPGYFGKVGIRKNNLHKNRICWRQKRSINIDKLQSLLPINALAESKKSKDKALVIDVTKLGQQKVLGKGTLPKNQIIVRAKEFSSEAETKIRGAGGVCELTA